MPITSWRGRVLAISEGVWYVVENAKTEKKKGEKERKQEYQGRAKQMEQRRECQEERREAQKNRGVAKMAAEWQDLSLRTLELVHIS